MPRYRITTRGGRTHVVNREDRPHVFHARTESERNLPNPSGRQLDPNRHRSDTCSVCGGSELSPVHYLGRR